MPRGNLLGSLECIVLLALVRLGPAAYGMTVRREIEDRLGRKLSIGAVYATLDRLEAKGLVESCRALAADASVSRRVFTVTSAGARSLALTRDTRERLWSGVTLRELGLTHGVISSSTISRQRFAAAVAHYQATGKKTLLDIAIRAADLLTRTFCVRLG